MKKANPLKKFVHFIFVPFISLMANMMTRLSTGGITCVYFSEISKGSTVAEEGDLTAEIYICCYEDVTSNILKAMFNNWSFHYPNTHLGYVVVDEAHHLGRQAFRTPVTTAFSEFNVSAPMKLLLLSGTVAYKRFGTHLKAMNIADSVTCDTSIGQDDIYVYDLVNSLPLQNVEKEFHMLHGVDLYRDALTMSTGTKIPKQVK